MAVQLNWTSLDARDEKKRLLRINRNEIEFPFTIKVRKIIYFPYKFYVGLYNKVT